jgi:hypothetical protein
MLKALITLDCHLGWSCPGFSSRIPQMLLIGAMEPKRNRRNETTPGDRRNGDDRQDMNESTHCVATDQSQKPQNEWWIYVNLSFYYLTALNDLLPQPVCRIYAFFQEKYFNSSVLLASVHFAIIGCCVVFTIALRRDPFRIDPSVDQLCPHRTGAIRGKSIEKRILL